MKILYEIIPKPIYYLPNLKMHKLTGRFDLFDIILAWDQARQWGKRQKTGPETGFFSFFSQYGAWSQANTILVF